MNLDKNHLYDAMRKGVSSTLESIFCEEAHCCENNGDASELPEGLWACLQILKPFYGKFTLCMPTELVQDLKKITHPTSKEGPPGNGTALSEERWDKESFNLDDETFNEKVQDPALMVYDVLGSLLGHFAHSLLSRLLEALVPLSSEFDMGVPYTGSGRPDTRGAYVCHYTLNGYTFWMALETAETARWKGIAPSNPPLKP
jgi:hypothetical protein